MKRMEAIRLAKIEAAKKRRLIENEAKKKALLDEGIDLKDDKVQQLIKRHDLLHILGATFTLLEKACRYLSLHHLAAGRHPPVYNGTDEPIKEYIRSGMAQRAVELLGRHTSPFLPHLAKQREEILQSTEMLTTSRQPRRARQAAEAAMELQAREEEIQQRKEWAKDEQMKDIVLIMKKLKKRPMGKPYTYRPSDETLRFDDPVKDTEW